MALINTHKYDDIIDLPRPVCKRSSRMTNYDRAAQFSPFAALTGYEDAVEEAARLTDIQTVLTEEAKSMLNEKLRMIAERIDDLPEVAITHFVPDDRKAGGAYTVTVGIVRELDPITGDVIMMDRQRIPVERIRDIAGDIFRGIE